MDALMIWLLVVGVAIGVGATLLLTLRLPRDDSDVGEEERRAEAAWISGVIERHGGVAPQPLVREVLDLHSSYLREVSLQGERQPSPVTGWFEPQPGPATAPAAPPTYPSGPSGAPGLPGTSAPPSRSAAPGPAAPPGPPPERPMPPPGTGAPPQGPPPQGPPPTIR